jgi:hypothetical protein
MKTPSIRAIVLTIAVMFLFGCATRTQSPINPLAEAETSPVATAGTSTLQQESIILPTPHIQTAPQLYYQDDDGLRLAISEIKTQAMQDPAQDERTWRYVVLTLTLTNYGAEPKDVTGFLFTVWLHEQTTNEDYAPELYAPSDIGLWSVIDQLGKGTVKRLERAQTVRGELYFKAPAEANKFNLIWQPDVQREWTLQVPELH